jgi:hypothetical protein
MHADMKALGDAIIASVRGYVATAVAAVAERLDTVDERIKAIPAGPRGEAGTPGERGEKGDPGATGSDGRSIGVEELQPIVRELVGAAVAALPVARDGQDGVAGQQGPQGDAGAPGQDGAPGEPGRDGVDGMAGDPGAPGEQGPPGETGRDGKDGRDGREGKDGSPGRDALEIDILPAIDPAKCYPRGTFAQWQGGIIRAIRHTEPLPEDGSPVAAGWASIVRGVAAIELRQVHERGFGLDVRFSDGSIAQNSFSMPTMVYRGVFREGTFERGDVVTWDGSLWHCEAPTTERPSPTNAAVWKLCAKRGRDGRNGERGEKGERGSDARVAVRG